MVSNYKSYLNQNKLSTQIISCPSSAVGDVEVIHLNLGDGNEIFKYMHTIHTSIEKGPQARVHW